MLDPPEPLRIAEETTLITEPIAEDGLPDFAAAMLIRLGRGTRPEDNGAIEFWRAVGPSEVEPEHRGLLFAEIGCPVPDEDGVLEPIREGALVDEVTAWLQARAEEGIDPELVRWQAEDLIELSQKRVASRETPPPIQAWIERNSEPLDLLVEAAGKPAFYSPPPNLLTDPPASLMEALLPAEQGLRSPARGLCVRAMKLAEQGQYEEAWKNADTVLTFGERLTEQPQLVPQLVGVSIRSQAFDVIQLLADQNDDLEPIP